MGRLIERCAGIDIGKRFLLCCVMTRLPMRSPAVKRDALTQLSRVWSDCGTGLTRSV